MWDPRAYQDTDFGLGEDESFEPKLDEEDSPGGPVVMTVLGPVEPDELGICLPFEHVLVSPNLRESSDRLDRIDLAAVELEHLASLGGRTLVDVTLHTQGRHVKGLWNLTQRVPSHIIAATGANSANDLDLASIERDIDEGIDGTGIVPGVIVTRETLGADGIRSLAGIAHARSYPFWVTAPSGESSLVANWLRQATCRPTTVVWFPADMPSESDIAAVVETGCSVGLTLAGKSDPDIDRLNATIAGCVAAGHGDRILVSFGAQTAGDLVAYGGSPGWPYLLERWILDLMEHNIDSGVVRQILIENPARALTIGA